MMRAELPVLSFLCAGLLVTILPMHIRRFNPTFLLIIAWLFVGNVIRGFTATNPDVHAPAYCDIATKLMLIENVAIPAACWRLVSHLELVASTRPILEGIYRHLAFALDTCSFVLLPLIYAGLHLLVQDHRFDRIEGYGCLAAIYPSMLTIILIWLPPLLLCSATLLYSGVAIFRACNKPTAYFSERLEFRSTTLTVSLFFRYTTVCALFAILLLSNSAYQVGLIVSEGLEPWHSFADVHKNFRDIPDIIPGELDVFARAGMELTWWRTPVLSIVAFVVSVAFSREWIGEWVRWSKTLYDAYHSRKTEESEADATSSTSSMRSSQFKPKVLILSTIPHRSANAVATDLRSGWDDTYDFKRSKPRGRSGYLASPPPDEEATISVPPGLANPDTGVQDVATPTTASSEPVDPILGGGSSENVPPQTPVRRTRTMRSNSSASASSETSSAGSHAHVRFAPDVPPPLPRRHPSRKPLSPRRKEDARRMSARNIGKGYEEADVIYSTG